MEKSGYTKKCPYRELLELFKPQFLFIYFYIFFCKWSTNSNSANCDSIPASKQYSASIAFTLALFSHLVNHVNIRLQAELEEGEGGVPPLHTDNTGMGTSVLLLSHFVKKIFSAALDLHWYLFFLESSVMFLLWSTYDALQCFLVRQLTRIGKSF